MSSVLDSVPAVSRSLRPVVYWIPVAVGLAVLYVPSFVELARGLWTKDEYLHGPIVLAVTAWIAWQQWGGLTKLPMQSAPVVGWLFTLIGLLLYIVGRSQGVTLFEIGSLLPLLVGMLLVLHGWPAVRQFWFPLLFLGFMVPLPSFIVDALTNPLKQQVSLIAENILYWAGYPIARSGVILSIGPYQLLVADACSGLHSLISMSAMGLLYIYLSGHRSIVRNAILASCLLPIAFTANVVRVMVLVLVTFYYGDEAGQGFIHDFSGIFLFIVGLLFLFLLDAVLGRLPVFHDRRAVP